MIVNSDAGFLLPCAPSFPHPPPTARGPTAYNLASIASPVRPDWFPSPVGDYVSAPLSADNFSRLRLIGLSEDEFWWFHDHFVGHFWNYGHKPAGGEWFSPSPSRRVSESLLIGHLEGRYHIATYCRKTDRGASVPKRYATDRFVIDLDTSETDPDLLNRYDAVTDALGWPTMVFRSSDSGGLHLHYWLDHEVDLQRLRSPDARRGLVPRLLAKAGLQLEPGRIELFPQGCYRDLARGNRLRVPFGSGSRLLDAQSFTPLTTSTIRDLSCLRAQVVAGEVSPVSFSGLFDRSLSAPRLRRRLHNRSAEPRHGGPSADVLRCEGLTGPGQLDGALRSLAFQCWRDDMSEAAAISSITEWLINFNNGCSRTYNRSPRAAVRMATQRVKSIYARQGAKPTRTWEPRPGLSPWEARSLLAHTDLSCNLETGEAVDRYKFQRFCFSLLECAKQWVLTELAPAGDGITDCAGYISSAASGVWPDASQPLFVAAIPHEHRVKVGGLRRDNVGPMWEAAKSTGLFSLVQIAVADAGRCELYSVRLDFGAYDDGPPVRTIDELLVCNLSAGERRSLYSSYRCKELARASGIGTIGEPVLGAVHATIRERLAQSTQLSTAA